MLFKIGLFLIPFENFFFAPSTGWAAIAPLIFFSYLIFNFNIFIKNLKESYKMVIFIIVMLLVGLMNSVIFKVLLSNIIDTFIAIVLGTVFYFSLYTRYKICKKDIKKDFQYLFWGYFISSLIGIFQWIAYKNSIMSFIKVIKFLSKRIYPRVQFCFTEPSFASVHFYGVILIIYLFFKKNNIKITKIQRYVTFIFPMLGIILSKSSRVILDTLIVIIMLMIYKVLQIKKIKVKISSIFFLIMLGLNVIIFKNNFINILGRKDSRIEKILKEGVYGDSSLASRYFRINSSIEGYKKNIKKLILGYGIGNAYYPMKLGYEEAKKEYRNSYTSEVESIKFTNNDTTVYCGYIRIMSEFGILFFSFILIKLYSKKYFFEYLIILYIYLQFDSYAFYSIWLYLFLKKEN